MRQMDLAMFTGLNWELGPWVAAGCVALFVEPLYLSWLALRLTLARWQPPSPPGDRPWPNVALVVPHFNEAPDSLLRTLRSIHRQAYPGRMVTWIVDDGSDVDLGGMLREWATQHDASRWRVVRYDVNSGSKGRVLDAALPLIDALCDVLVVVDSDTELDDGALASLVVGLWADDRCAAACGYLLPSNPDESLLTRMQACEYSGVLSSVKVAQNRSGFVPVMAGAFMAHRMSAIRHCGGWQQWIVEDMGWTWRALAYGFRTAFVAGAVAWTRCPSSLTGLIRQRRRWLRGPYESVELPFVNRWRWLRLNGRACRSGLHAIGLTFAPTVVVALASWRLWMVAVGVLSVAHALAIVADPSRQRHPRRWRPRTVLESLVLTRLLRIVLWWPAFLGFLDAALRRRNLWLTRGDTHGRP